MSLLSVLISSALSFAVPVGTATLPDGYADASSKKKLEISIITEEQAKSIYSAVTADEMIPFKSPEACYANATAVSQQAEEFGIITGRIRIDGVLNPMTYNNPDYPQAHWQMHTAAMVFVRNAKGENILTVIDPALASKPISVEEWKAKMLASYKGKAGSIKRVTYGSRFQMGDPDQENSRDEWNQDDVEMAERDRAAFRRYLFFNEVMYGEKPRINQNTDSPVAK